MYNVRRLIIAVFRYCDVSRMLFLLYYRAEYRVIKMLVIYFAGEYIYLRKRCLSLSFSALSPSRYISTYLRHPE